MATRYVGQPVRRVEDLRLVTDQIGLILVPQKDIKPEDIPETVNSDPGAPIGHLFMSMGFT